MTHDETAHIRRQLEESLARIRQLEEELVAGQRSRDDFLGAMSHEFYTPLNHIIGFSDLLLLDLADGLNDDQRRQLTAVRDAGRYLYAMAQDILDLASLRSDTLRLSDDHVHPAEVVGAAVEQVTPIAREKGVTVSSTVSGGLPLLRTDSRRLRQTLVRLIGNAIKFTDVGGTVTIGASAGEDRVRFAVSDNGRGIPEGNLPGIFDEFRQLPQPDIAKSPGAGVGLTISRAVIERLGGRLHAESAMGVGSTFWFELPVARGSDTTSW